ncbi:MAG: hypothetical protein JSR78_20530 [Proteobacteria bacterium]|nr:hypothetical protein [Pseudomonadota bacterium]
MNDKLLSPKLKIERANKHIVDATAQIITFLNTNGNLIETFMEPEPGGLRQIIKARFLKRPPPEIAGAVGDAISNLRSSLDHLVRCLAINHSGSPPYDAAFPFDKDRDKFESPGTQRKIAALSPEAQQMIRDLQPYAVSETEPEKGGNNMLWALNKLRNSDVHRLIAPIGMVTVGHKLNVQTRGHLGLNTIEAPKWVRFDEDMTAELMRVPGAASDIQGNLQTGIDIGFGDIEPVAGYPVLRVLHDFSNLAKRILLTFEQRFFT